MKKIKIMMPVLAFLFAIGAVFATASASSTDLLIKYKDANGECQNCQTVDQGARCGFTGNNRCKCTSITGNPDAWVIDASSSQCVELKYE